MIRAYLNKSLKGLAKSLPVLVAVVLWQCSCGRSRKDDDCTRHIRERILPSSTVQSAESELKKCGYQVTFKLEDKYLYGNKMVPDRSGVVFERTQVVVYLDPNSKVSRVVVTTGLIGP
jgi:hypothetical protein